MGNNDSGVRLVNEQTLVNLLDEIHSLKRDMALMRECLLENSAQNGMLKSVLAHVTRDANRLRSELRGEAADQYRPRGGVVSAAQQNARADRERARAWERRQ